MLVVEAAFSKHHCKDTLPMHPDLMPMVRDWVNEFERDEFLVLLIGREKTWCMLREDLERVCIPDETPEDIADFHAAEGHSHLTGLVRSGATIIEAKLD